MRQNDIKGPQGNLHSSTVQDKYFGTLFPDLYKLPLKDLVIACDTPPLKKTKEGNAITHPQPHPTPKFSILWMKAGNGTSPAFLRGGV